MVCKDRIIFEDNFDSDILNENNWIIAQFIPQAPVSRIIAYKLVNSTLFRITNL